MSNCMLKGLITDGFIDQRFASVSFDAPVSFASSHLFVAIDWDQISTELRCAPRRGKTHDRESTIGRGN